MVKDLLEHRGVGNATNDSYVVFGTGFTLGNVDVEYSLEALRPRHTARLI